LTRPAYLMSWLPRAGYRLRYFWSDVSTAAASDRTRYHCRRRHPAGSARCDVEVEIGPAVEAGGDEPAVYVTANYRLFTVIADELAATEAQHAPWPLHYPTVLTLDQNLLTAAGLPPPAGDPLARSPGVRVRIGMWQR
jgi:uncharacterized protein YqjF (DUF2071 family)